MDGLDKMNLDPSELSLSQLRLQQQQKQRAEQSIRLDPTKGQSSSSKGNQLDENWLREIIMDQIRLSISPILNEIKEEATNLKGKTAEYSNHENKMVTEPINRKRRKFPVWDGEKSSFNSYIRELEDCIEIDRELIGSNRAVWYDINYSLPTKAKQKVSIFYAGGGNIDWDYRKFIAHLKRTFSNKKEKEDKQELLTRLKQRDNQRFVDFFPIFDEALAGSGGEKWTEDSKLLWLRRSLSEALKDQLFSVDLDPDDYYGSVKKIEGVAYRFEQSRQFKGTKGNFRSLDLPQQDNTLTPQPTLDSDGDVIMNRFNSNNMRSGGNNIRNNDGNKKGNTSNFKQRRAAYVDKTVLDYRRANKLCMRCGANGHYVPNCPYLPPKRPEVPIKSTDVKVPPMLDEDYEKEVGAEKD